MSWRLALASIAFWGMVAFWLYVAIEVGCAMMETWEECLSSEWLDIAGHLASAAFLYGFCLYVRHRYRNA